MSKYKRTDYLVLGILKNTEFKPMTEEQLIDRMFRAVKAFYINKGFKRSDEICRITYLAYYYLSNLKKKPLVRLVSLKGYMTLDTYIQETQVQALMKLTKGLHDNSNITTDIAYLEAILAICRRYFIDSPMVYHVCLKDTIKKDGLCLRN